MPRKRSLAVEIELEKLEEESQEASYVSWLIVWTIFLYGSRDRMRFRLGRCPKHLHFASYTEFAVNKFQINILDELQLKSSSETCFASSQFDT